MNQKISDFAAGFNSGDYSLVEDQSTGVFKKTNMVQSGSNSNGSWIKYADGTMICYGTISVSMSASTFGSASKTWAATFTATPVTVLAVVEDGHYNYWASTGAKSTTGCTVYVATAASATATIAVSVMAVGRWW